MDEQAAQGDWQSLIVRPERDSDDSFHEHRRGFPPCFTMRTPTLNRIRGLTLLDVLIVLALLAALVVVLLPALARPKSHSRISCINNLKQVGISVSVWAGDHENKMPWEISSTREGTAESIGTRATFRHFQVLSNELGTPRILICQKDQMRSAATNFTTDFNNSHVSYFLNFDAATNDPNSVLAGDDNLLLNGVPVRSGPLEWRPGEVMSWTDKRHIK